MSAFRLLRPLDLCVIIPALALVAASAAAARAGGERPAVGLRAESGRWVFPLDASETVAVPGPLGETVVEIRGGEARVASSPCADQTCVAMGGARLPGQWAACLPNRVMLYVSSGGGSGAVDATAW